MTYELGQGSGPLRGIRVVEIAGIGPGPHAATILADLGSDVIRIERPGGVTSAVEREHDLLTRGRPGVVLDLKDAHALEIAWGLVERADVLVEGLRPGAMERLGLGPDECLARNPPLVYARMTGWGQDGPLAPTAGHDIDYIAISGALHGLGQVPERPQFPTNLLGDFGGGSTYLVIGVLSALLEARTSGRGQVVDAAIVDGVAHLSLMNAGLLASGLVSETRANGLLNGGAPFYGVYETADGQHMAVGAIEPVFWAALVEGLGLSDVPDRNDRAQWPRLHTMLTERFARKTRDEWSAIFEGTDACCAPVLSMSEAARHPHLASRSTYVERAGVLQPAPAPRFSRTPARLTSEPAPALEGADAEALLAAWGLIPVDPA